MDTRTFDPGSQSPEQALEASVWSRFSKLRCLLVDLRNFTEDESKVDKPPEFAQEIVQCFLFALPASLEVLAMNPPLEEEMGAECFDKMLAKFLEGRRCLGLDNVLLR